MSLDFASPRIEVFHQIFLFLPWVFVATTLPVLVWLLSDYIETFKPWVQQFTNIFAILIPASALIYLIYMVLRIVRRATFRSRSAQLRSKHAFSTAISGMAPSFMLEELNSILRGWAPSKREDFVYRLMRDGRTIPPEAASDYARYVSEKYADNDFEDRQLRVLITSFVELPESARKDFADLLRHQF